MDQVADQERPLGSAVRHGSRLATPFARRSPRPHRPVPPSAGGGQQRHQDALAVLDGARAVLQRGWAQDVWYVLRDSGGRLRGFGPTSLTRLDHTEVVQACLVGAVLHAAWRQSPHGERAHPALDALWRTLREPHGAESIEPVGPVSSPPVRAARVRDLTRWNDQPDRTRDEVLQLLDRTIVRVAGAPTTSSTPR